MAFYDYRCEAGHEFEARGGYDTATLPCQVCGLMALRQFSGAFAFSVDGRVSVPLDQRRVKLSKFMEASQELDYRHRKAEESAQRPLDNPSYFREGVRRAKEVMAGKRAPPAEF